MENDGLLEENAIATHQLTDFWNFGTHVRNSSKTRDIAKSRPAPSATIATHKAATGGRAAQLRMCQSNRTPCRVRPMRFIELDYQWRFRATNGRSARCTRHSDTQAPHQEMLSNLSNSCENVGARKPCFPAVLCPILTQPFFAHHVKIIFADEASGGF